MFVAHVVAAEEARQERIVGVDVLLGNVVLPFELVQVEVLAA